MANITYVVLYHLDLLDFLIWEEGERDVPAAEECVDAIDVVDDFDGFHGGIQAFVYCLL